MREELDGGREEGFVGTEFEIEVEVGFEATASKEAVRTETQAT